MFGVWPAARSQKSFYKAAASNMLGSFSTTLAVRLVHIEPVNAKLLKRDNIILAVRRLQFLKPQLQASLCPL